MGGCCRGWKRGFALSPVSWAAETEARQRRRFVPAEPFQDTREDAEIVEDAEDAGAVRSSRRSAAKFDPGRDGSTLRADGLAVATESAPESRGINHEI